MCPMSTTSYTINIIFHFIALFYVIIPLFVLGEQNLDFPVKLVQETKNL